jgi:hypothetical protein
MRVISARVGAQVSALQRLFSEPHRFICNGVELLEHMTLDFYEIRDGDVIIALPGELQGLYKVADWITVTRDSDTFNQTVQSILNTRTAREVYRLRDLHIMRLEGRAKSYRHVGDHVTFHGRLTESPGQKNTQVNFAEAAAPCAAALPVCW